MQPVDPPKLTDQAPAPSTLYRLLMAQALYRNPKGNRRALRKLEKELPRRPRP